MAGDALSTAIRPFRSLKRGHTPSGYRYLRSSFITAFFPNSDTTGLLKRLGALYHEKPHYPGRPDRQYCYANANYLPCVYELNDAGRQLLKREGISVLKADSQAGSVGEHRHFAHALMICDILASIELGCLRTQ